MEKKIVDFTNETFRFKHPKVQFYPEIVSINIGTGAKASGSFKVFLEKENRKETDRIRGYFTCTDHRMKIEPLTIHGPEAEITYTYNGENILAGENGRGSICFISSNGEYELPYSITIANEVLSYKDVEIANIDDFVKLAYEDFAGAVTLFYTEAFPKVLLSGHKEAELVRKGLLYSTDRYHALEEFLCFLGAKEKVRLRMDKLKYDFHLSNSSFRYKIVIHKNTWGYFRAKLTSDTSTLFLSKEELSEKDFLGNQCEIEVGIEPETFMGNRKTVKLVLNSLNHTAESTIHLIRLGNSEPIFTRRNRSKETMIRALKAYYSYRLGLMSLRDMSAVVRNFIYEDAKLKKRDEQGYLSAYLDYLDGETEEAKKMIAENEGWEKTPLAGAMHLYLKFLLEKEQKNLSYVNKMEDLAKNYSVSEAYFFIMDMEERFQKNLKNRYELLSKLCEAGMNRSFLFLEAWVILNEEPEILTRLDVLTIRAFAKAIRIGFSVKKELIKRYSLLAEELKDYRPLVCSTLKVFYEREKNEEALTSIISQLLKADKIYADTNSFLALGIKQGIKRTGIYELYTKSLSEDQFIEPQCYTYFLYGDSLNREIKTVMYSFLMRNKDKEAFREIYSKYKNKIKDFALQEMERSIVSGHHLVMYQELLKSKRFLADARNYLPNILFKKAVFVEDDRFKHIVSVTDELLKPSLSPIVEKEAYCDFLRDSSILLLSDASGRLFVDWEHILVEDLFDLDLYLEELYQVKEKNLFTSIVLFKREENRKSNVYYEISHSFLNSSEIEEELKRKATKGLILYYEAKNDFLRLEECIDEIRIQDFKREDARLITDIILKHKIKPFIDSGIRYLGVKNVNILYLKDYVLEALEHGEHYEERLLLEAGLRLLKENAGNDRIYLWLAEHVEASLEVLLKLYQRFSSGKIIPIRFKEKIMEQALFTENLPSEIDEIFLEYENKDSIFTRAYLNYCYYRFLLKDIPFGSYVDRKLPEDALSSKSLLPVIAYLKRISKKEVLLTEEKEFAIIRLLRLVEDGIVLPFFKDFIGKCKVPAEIENVTFASCNADAKDEVSIQYMIKREGEKEASPDVTEWMKNVYMGIFVKEFLIFVDETVKYLISKKEETNSVIKSGELSIDPDTLIDQDENISLYAEINHILLAKELDDKKAVVDSIKKYIIQKEVVKDIFNFKIKKKEV